MSNYNDDRSERFCSHCKEWRPFTKAFWYIAPSGHASRGKCKVCMYPNGVGTPGRKPGTLVNAAHRNKLIARAAAKVYRIDEIKLDPSAAIRFARSIGLDPARIAAWFAEETISEEIVSSV